MPSRIVRRIPAYALRCSLAVLALSASTWTVSAQELPFQRDYPGSTSFSCGAFTAPGVPQAEARTQAGQLASSAAQAVLLGESDRALALLDRAAELDPASADLAYRRGRVLEDLGDRNRAIDEYCRSLGLVADGSTADDARARLERLVEMETESVPADAVAAFRTGLESVERRAFGAALEAFESAAEQAVDWPAAVYNQGATLDRLERFGEAAQAFSRYLDLRPDAPDALAVSRRIGQLQGLALSEGPSPGTALALGTLLPGLGHFYADRKGAGFAVLALAGGAVAAGFLITEVDVRCLTPSDTGCPPEQVVSRTTTRPYLTASLGAAAAVGIAAAIEAFVEARGRRGGTTLASDGESSAVVALPGVVVRDGRIGIGLLGVRFR